ncbi:MAG: chromosomal replication initiator protein DnaA [Verrucomicrobia bacterium]|nr:chromosomal replication initiator protein DnaA [Verrucomicrobiota bacterium]
MNNAEAVVVWQRACELLRSDVSQELFNLWFAPLKPIELSANTLTLGTPNDFYEVWLQENYGHVIDKALTAVSGQRLALKFASLPAGHVPKESAAKEAMDSRSEAALLEPRAPAAPMLHRRNTFENFVVGPNNEMAHAAALSVAQSPGRAYNPLFIYGATGLGKTHLLQAIGHYVLARRNRMRVVYVTCEQFLNGFIEALASKTMTSFRKCYRNADILLVDDIHSLAGKESTQEEFFHTFNTLFDAHKQIVISCDRPASEIAGLEERLITRFEWGQTVDLQPPDLETRIAILRKKQHLLGFHVPEEVVIFLAEKIRANIRRLEGALIRVASYGSLPGRTVDVPAVERLLADLLTEEARRALTVDAIQKRVAQHFDIRLADMTSKRRPASIAFPRMVAMYLSRQLTNHSLSQIGEAFGGRDHGTVINACKQISKAMQSDAGLRQAVGFLQQQLKRE